MNTPTKRQVGLFVAPILGVCLLAGCGDGGTRSQSPRTQEKRAREVADATQPPESGWHSDADKQAYEARTVVRRGKLPTTAIAQGTVK